MPLADADAVVRNLGSRDRLVLDARTPERYRGEQELIDPVAGHIPGARNRPWQRNLDADQRFKSPQMLREEFATVLGAAPPSKVIHQCGSGVTACHNLLAMEIAGLPGSALYAGSWSEWIADPARPVATGEEPAA
jgi:thiosulfate/3-mercaptopyruvate sulfurtransferase